MNKNNITLFVYGTLKKGFVNHDRYMKNAEFLGTDTITGQMYELQMTDKNFRWYPHAYEGEGIIHGELYSVSVSQYEKIKQLEMSVGYYVKTVLTHGEVACSVFFYDKPDVKTHGVRIVTY